MVANRHVLVVGQQRVVGAEQFADVLRVLDTDVEVGVVIDPRRYVHLAIGSTVQHVRFTRLQCAAFGQQRQQALAQCHARATAQFEKGVQLATGGRLDGATGVTVERIDRGVQVQDRVANRHASARCGAVDAEHAQRQVLQRKIGVTIRGGHPAAGECWLRHGFISGSG